MPKKPMNRTFTEPTSQQEKEKVPKHNRSTMSLNRQLSTNEGGSCPNSPQVKKACRLVVLGSIQTGKTSILSRFLNDTYDESYLPTIENFHRKFYRIHGEFYQLDILDTSGNDPFPAARRLSLLTGDLFLLVFSVDNPSSYEQIFRLRDQILEAKDTSESGQGQSVNGRAKGIIQSISSYSSTSSASSSSSSLRIPMAVAANKIDLPVSKHAVNLEEARAKIMSLSHCVFVECSAKTGRNIDELFTKLFLSAKLPKQMSPGQHRHVVLERSLDSALPASGGVRDEDSAIAADGGKLKSSIIRIRNKQQQTAVCFEAEARRPSLRTDLMLLRAKQSTNVCGPTSASSWSENGGGRYGRNAMKQKKCVVQ